MALKVPSNHIERVCSSPLTFRGIAVAAVLANWHNVLRAINMASGEDSPTLDTHGTFDTKDLSENTEAKDRQRGRGRRRK